MARAEVSSVQPSSGRGAPGETVSALVTVSTEGLTSCVTATADTALVVTFDGLTTKCGSGTWSATMEVAIPPVTAPGTYTVDISELALGGALLTSYPWSVTVISPATTTTTTVLPELTLPPILTTIVPTTTTSTTALTTTSTTQAATVPTTTAPFATSSTGRTIIATTPDGPDPDDAPSDAVAPAGDGAASVLAADRGTEQAPAISDAETFSEVAVTSGLIDIADRALPPVFAQAVLSPLVILEVLLRALGRTTAGLLIPLGLTVLAGLGLAARLRRDAEQLPELEEGREIPEEDDLS